MSKFNNEQHYITLDHYLKYKHVNNDLYNLVDYCSNNNYDINFIIFAYLNDALITAKTKYRDDNGFRTIKITLSLSEYNSITYNKGMEIEYIIKYNDYLITISKQICNVIDGDYKPVLKSDYYLQYSPFGCTVHEENNYFGAFIVRPDRLSIMCKIPNISNIIPSSVTKIVYYNFYLRNSLVDNTILPSVNELDLKLKCQIKIPSNVKILTIEYSGYITCRNIIIPESVVSLNINSNVTVFNLPKKLETLILTSYYEEFLHILPKSLILLSVSETTIKSLKTKHLKNLKDLHIDYYPPPSQCCDNCSSSFGFSKIIKGLVTSCNISCFSR
jgi:hypothetical protein